MESSNELISEMFYDIINYDRFLGSSGENIDNIYCYTNGLDSLDILERTLYWSHMAPTAPDTLGKLYLNITIMFII